MKAWKKVEIVISLMNRTQYCLIIPQSRFCDAAIDDLKLKSWWELPTTIFLGYVFSNFGSLLLEMISARGWLALSQETTPTTCRWKGGWSSFLVRRLARRPERRSGRHLSLT